MFVVLVRAIIILFLVASTQSTFAQESISRRNIENKIREDQGLLTTAFWVKFKVEQTDFGRDFENFVHVSGSSDSPATRWFGEHAHETNGKRFDYTSIAAERTDKKFSAKIGDGECCYGQSDLADLINVYRGSDVAFRNYLLPEEDLYREIIGMDSRRQDVGITVKGFRSAEPYNIAQIASDASFKFENTERATYCFSKTGVESVWLDESKGYSVVRVERFVNGVPAVTIENSQFELIGSALWLPRKSVITYYDVAGIKVAKATLQVQSLSLSPPAELFKPQFDKFPGLCDVEKGFNPVKLGPLKGKSMIEFLDSAPTLVLEPKNTSGYGKLLTWVLCIVVLLSGFFLYRKMRR